MRVLLVAPGAKGHGVVRHAQAVGALLELASADVRLERSPEPALQPDVTHVQFTDALWGDDIGSAADSFVAWAESRPGPVVVTLHDLPGPGPNRDARRREGYRRVVAVTAAVVVSSPHEVDRAVAVGASGVVVIPLPVPGLGPAGPVPAWAGRDSLVVLGFVYPGKGHEEVLRAASPGTLVVALGGVSPGHEDLAGRLRRLAAAREVELLVTGPVSDADLHAGLLAATVPVAAYSTDGASASIATWLAAGRRPVVLPGTHSPAGPLVSHALDHDLARLLADPAPTWAPPPPTPDVAAAHLAVYRSVLA